jgi:hypothetical protein
MSQMGQQRRFCNVRDESAYPPIAALKRTCFGVAFVPFPDSCIAANNQGAPIRDPGDPIRVEIRLRQRLVHARLIGTKGAAALEQQRDTFEGRMGWHVERPRTAARASPANN